jgi:lysophospholipase L1-like esterase
VIDDDLHVLRRPHRRVKRLLAVLVACVVIAAVVIPLAWTNGDEGLPMPVPEPAEPPTLIALGDSYTSGQGVIPYQEDSGECFRSSAAYPALVLDKLGIEGRNVACGGATTAALTSSYANEPPQLNAIGDADIVVMSFGGNDVRGLQTLATNPTSAISPQFVENFETMELPTLATKLDTSYAAIKQQLEPGTEVFALGYPNLFPPNRAAYQYCDGLQLPLGPAAYTLPLENLHRLNAGLNNTVRDAANRAGFTFVDVALAFVTHDICAEFRLIWGTVDPPVREGAMHPSGDGHRVMSETVAAAIRSKVDNLP